MESLKKWVFTYVTASTGEPRRRVYVRRCRATMIVRLTRYGLSDAWSDLLYIEWGTETPRESALGKYPVANFDPAVDPAALAPILRS
jgi:hypothetical protein